MGRAIDPALFGRRGKPARRHLRSDAETQMILVAKFMFTYEQNY
jgi:hypothetical protein